MYMAGIDRLQHVLSWDMTWISAERLLTTDPEVPLRSEGSERIFLAVRGPACSPVSIQGPDVPLHQVSASKLSSHLQQHHMFLHARIMCSAQLCDHGSWRPTAGSMSTCHMTGLLITVTRAREGTSMNSSLMAVTCIT